LKRKQNEELGSRVSKRTLRLYRRNAFLNSNVDEAAGHQRTCNGKVHVDSVRPTSQGRDHVKVVTEFGIPKKLVRLPKTCLKENYNDESPVWRPVRIPPPQPCET
jgi:hypothetical protein